MPLGVRPPRWQRRTVHAAVLTLALTGIAWLLAHYFGRSQGQLGSELPHPAEPWLLRLHGIAAYASLLVLGSMGTVHVALAWRLRRNRSSGTSLLAATALLALTALSLYYGPEAAHAATSLAHWLCGLALLPLLWLHVALARRRRE